MRRMGRREQGAVTAISNGGSQSRHPWWRFRGQRSRLYVYRVTTGPKSALSVLKTGMFGESFLGDCVDSL
jgi:hypothetical protein